MVTTQKLLDYWKLLSEEERVLLVICCFDLAHNFLHSIIYIYKSMDEEQKPFNILFGRSMSPKILHTPPSFSLICFPSKKFEFTSKVDVSGYKMILISDGDERFHPKVAYSYYSEIRLRLSNEVGRVD